MKSGNLKIAFLGLVTVSSVFYFFYYFSSDISSGIDLREVAVLISGNKNEAALAKIDSYLKTHPKNGMLYYYKAAALRNLKNYDGALAELDKSIKLGYPEIQAYNLKGSILGEDRKDYDSEIFYAGKSVALDPTDPEGYFIRGLGLSGRGDYFGAAADFTAASEMDPEFDEALIQKAITLKKNGDCPKALNEFSRLLKKYSSSDKAWYDVYSCYRQEGRFNNALYSVSKAVELSPDSTEYLKARASLLSESGDYYGTCRDLEKASNIEGKESSSLDDFALAVCFYRTGFYGEALKSVNSAFLKNSYPPASFYELRGKIYLQKGFKKKALKEWEKMGAISPENSLREKRYIGEILNFTGD